MLIIIRRYKALFAEACCFRLRTAGVCSVALLLWSCAVPPGESVQTTRLPTDAEVEQYNAQVSPEERIVCREEITVGTNIPERKCRYIRDIEETGRIHREQLRNILH